jgi:hypothetical protein
MIHHESLPENFRRTFELNASIEGKQNQREDRPGLCKVDFA